ncbi:MAG: hypothetical protein AB1498_01455 [bacterium]
MDPRVIPLYYLSSFAGLIMVAGGIWLLYKQKIYIDRESKEVTEIETPIGKFKTNIPALILFALGFVPLIYPIIKSSEITEQVSIKGMVKANEYPVQVYAVIKSDSIMENRDFSLQVPVLKNITDEYKVIYLVGNMVFEDRADLKNQKNGEIVLPGKEIQSAVAANFKTKLQPVPEEF